MEQSKDDNSGRSIRLRTSISSRGKQPYTENNYPFEEVQAQLGDLGQQVDFSEKQMGNKFTQGHQKDKKDGEEYVSLMCSSIDSHNRTDGNFQHNIQSGSATTIFAIKGQLGQSFRVDGPHLGVHFDSPPDQGAFAKYKHQGAFTKYKHGGSI